jgi:urea transporter
MYKQFLQTVLNGYSQVMLQRNWITGLLFLIGILVNSWTMAIGSILGVLAGTYGAQMLKYPEKEIQDGLYGFNGVLVGIAGIFFLGFDYLPIIAIVIFSILSAIMTHYFLKFKIPPFTAPFVISAWLMIALLGMLGINQISAPVSNQMVLDPIGAISKGVSQVMFQENILTGGLFLLGLLASSWLVALFGLAGSIAGVLVPVVHSLPFDQINAGLFGYNAVLCGVAFAGKKKHSLAFGLLAILLSILITYLMMRLPLAVLTAPFVISTWVILCIKTKA